VVAVSLAFIVVYTIIGVVDAWLFVRAARLSLDDTGEEVERAELAGLVY